jgi:hypothetical protein
VGYWGVSLGSAIGVPFVAAEPRVAAAVFGLAGHALAEAAARVTVPVEFLLPPPTAVTGSPTTSRRCASTSGSTGSTCSDTARA